MNRKDSKRKSHQECPGKTGGRGRPRQARRHKTCPSPREISKVMASMALGMLNEGGCSEDDLLEKCIQSFDSAGSLRHGDHILNMLSLDLFHTEDEIYELSYAREPRCPKSLPPSPFRVPLVVEWAPGVTPKPDRVTLGRHVEQLVESVFKNYDPEGRGTISQEDFERLSGNFPFACRGLHPPPRQGSGSFSREELTGYLLQASAICSKLGLAFLHTFQEVTFRKPTFCGSCSGFVSTPPAVTLRDPWSALTPHSLGWKSQPCPGALTFPKPRIIPKFQKIL
ncbi:RAS guanyl-releasing protein 4, partial [Eschrichtius robustus]|nr:RAS guanyl-releasing protein 4 [Eschrichtius robustus]